MFSLRIYSILVAFFCSQVLGEKIALIHDLHDRQIFVPVSTSCSGTLCPKSTSSSFKSSSSSAVKVISSSSSTRVSSSSVSRTSSSLTSITSKVSTLPSSTTISSSASYNSLKLTTTFTQPPECTGGFTAIQDWGTDLFNNLIYSQPGFNLGYTSCFPPQFYSSVLAMSASTTVGAFSALICPYTWETYDINSTYIICCPKGYNLIAPNLEDTVRPGDGAVCSSAIGGGALLDITTFDSTGGQIVVAATAGDDGTIVWANAFDGFTTSLANLSTSTSSFMTTKSSLISSSSSLTTKSSSSSAATSKAASSTSLVSTSKASSSSSSASTSKDSSSSSLLSTSKASSSSSLASSSKASSSSSLASTSKTSSSSVSTIKVSSSSSSQSSSKPISTSASKTTSSSRSSSKVSTTTVGTAIPGESNLPACGQTCFNNMLAQYSTLGCAPLDSYCLCSNVNFGFGLRDCSNGACGTAVASTVIAFGNAYCSSATATHTPTVSTAIPGESALPACGQTCFNNMLAQYSTLGCAPLDSYCLCSNVNFGFGLRDCSNGACGTAVASTVIAFGSAYCSTATATHTARATTTK